jgi:glyoxylase-like metal-dependent hydrolase (beta-lactamase superfamily II)
MTLRPAVLLAALLGLVPALAAAAEPGLPAPGVFRQMVGDVEVTALLDGEATLPPEYMPDVHREEMAAIAAQGGQSIPVRSPMIVYAVRTGDRLYLVDAGAGDTGGPALGRLPESLAAAGIAPAEVDAILVTHMHPEHVGGLTRDGRAVFPNAELILPDVDAGYWLDPKEEASAAEHRRRSFEIAQAAVAPYAERTRRIAVGTRVARSIQAVPLPGHSIGHTGYLIASGEARLLIWGDIVQNAALHFPRPGWTSVLDHNRNRSSFERRRVFDMAVKDAIMVAGMHLPFPGIGHVERDGPRYRFRPISGETKD